MADNKTQPTAVEPAEFIAGVANERRRTDAERMLVLMRRATGEEPRMWGSSIVGFGRYHYRYASGREGDAAVAGFSPRKAATVVYLTDGVGAHEGLLARLGPHKTGTGCLYLASLEGVDLGVLEEIVRTSYTTLTEGTYGKRASEG